MCLDMSFWGESFGQKIDNFNGVVASVQPGDLCFTENDFASGGVVGGGSGNESGRDLVSAVEKFDRAPRSYGIGGGEDDTAEGFGDLRIGQDGRDPIFAEKTIAEFEDDDIGIRLGELVHEGDSEIGGIGGLGGDNAEVSENGNIRSSGVLHCEDVSAEGDPGGFGGRDLEAPTDELLNDCEAGFSFAGIHARANDSDDGGKIALKFGLEGEGVGGDIRGNTLAGIEGGEAENAPEDFALVRRSNEWRMTCANPENAAHIEEVDGISSFEGFWDMAGVTLEGVSMSKCAGNNVALLEDGHSSRRKLEGIVSCLVCENTDGDNIAFLTGVVVADSDISAESSILGDAGDFVENESPHEFASGLARA